MIGPRIAAGLRSIGAPLAALIEAAALIGGAFLIAFGAWQAYPPAGPIVGGLLLVLGAILRARGAAQ